MKAAGNVWLLFFLEGADSGRASAHSPPGLQGFFRRGFRARQLPSVAGRGGAFRPPRKTERQDKIKDPSEDGSFILYSTGLLSFGLRGFFSAGFRSLLHHRATAIADLRRIEFGTGGFRDGRGSGRPSEPKTISQEQYEMLSDLMRTTGTTAEDFLRYLNAGVESISELPPAHFPRAKSALEAKAAKQARDAAK